MSIYFGQFEMFDPLLGKLPEAPFSLLPMIALRARALVRTRTQDQIQSVAEAIDYAIFSHFEEIKENEIYRLKKILRQTDEDSSDFQLALQFFEWDGGSSVNGHWLFKDGMEDSLEISTPNNTSEVDALKELSLNWVDIVEGFTNGKGYELFAVLSLWQLADTLKWINYKRDENMKAIHDNFVNFLTVVEAESNITGLVDLYGNEKEQNLSLAGQSALKAMDSVCYAEYLFSLENEIAKTKEKHKIEYELEEKKRKSMVSQKLNIARHQKRNEAMSLVTDEWNRDPNRFSSADKAANYFSSWLNEKGIEFEPRTIAEWIRKYAKQIGKKFR